VSETETGITSNRNNIEALIAAWTAMVGRLPGNTIERSAGVATSFAHVPLPLLNLSILDRAFVDGPDFRGAVGVARERARACRHGSLVAVCPAWAPAEWGDIAAEEGLRASLNITGMASDDMAPPRRAPPPMDYRLASDPATAADLASVNAHAYDMPVEMVECIANVHLWSEMSFGVVGYVAGRAVTCAAAFVIGDMIYIALVATLPKAHGGGYAEAAMRRAIQYARDAAGPKRLWLHATDMGRPLYRSMGFSTGAEIPLFEFADQAGAH
jgi:GNAT superfamily N-acetyltransferase